MVPSLKTMAAPELNPDVADVFFTCLPDIASRCVEATLHSLSAVSKSYYKRMRENPVVPFLYRWRPTVELYRLAVCYSQVGQYYNITKPAHDRKIIRWQEEPIYQYFERHGWERPSEDTVLTLEDYLLSDEWEKLDVTRIDTQYYYFLRDEAAARLATLCSRRGEQLPAFRNPPLQMPRSMWFRTTSQGKRVLQYCVLSTNWKMLLIEYGMFSLLAPMKVRRLPIPTYEPVAVQEAFGAEEMPRYINEQEYGDMLVNWWLPLVYQLKNDEAAITIEYGQLDRLPPQIAKRLLLGTDSSYTHLLSMPHDSDLEVMRDSDVKYLKSIVQLLASSCVQVQLDKYTSASRLVDRVASVCNQQELCEFVKALYDASVRASREKIMKELELCGSTLLCYEELLQYRIDSITRGLNSLEY